MHINTLTHEDLNRLVCFCILMENGDGIRGKSPDYIREKFRKAMAVEYPAIMPRQLSLIVLLPITQLTARAEVFIMQTVLLRTALYMVTPLH